VGRSLATAGRAVRWNAVVLGLGFLVLTFSALPPNRVLGLLLAAAMLAAYLMTVLLLPRLLRATRSGG
jgi:predicted RND superfamily exporter protein